MTGNTETNNRPGEASAPLACSPLARAKDQLKELHRRHGYAVANDCLTEQTLWNQILDKGREIRAMENTGDVCD